VDKEIPVRMGGMNREQRLKKKKVKPVVDEDGDIASKKQRHNAILYCGADYRRRGKKKRSVSPDPYGHLVRDVPFNQPVQAPPTLSAPKHSIKSSLPNSLSAARKDILESERQDVIAKYRQRMGRT
jgi:hypothetical protein